MLFPTPAWVSFAEQVRFAGAQPVFVPTDPGDGFSPCNPTGGTWSASELEAPVRGCAAAGVFLVSDETYERFVYDEAPRSAASSRAELERGVERIEHFLRRW